MRRLTQFSFLLALLAFTSTFTSCSKDEDTTPDPVDQNPTNPTTPDPVEEKSVLEFLAEKEEFSTFLAALERTELDDVITANDKLTIFAPTNEAFETLFADNGWTSLDQMGTGSLNIIMKYHISTVDKYMSTEFENDQRITILYLDKQLILKLNDPDLPRITTGGFSVANIPVRDLETTDGVIHKIDKVLVP